MPPVYIEENNVYQIDCSAAVWSSDQLHGIYQESNHKYGWLGFLCDVDCVIENDKCLYLVEYKNANIAGASKPAAFKPQTPEKLTSVARKYFDSLHWISLLGKDKPRKLVYILEYPQGTLTTRLLVRNELAKYLPFKLQKAYPQSGRKLIDEVMVVDIAEWNAHPDLGKYPIAKI